MARRKSTNMKVSAAIRKEMRAGKPRKQAIAIGMSKAGMGKKK